MQRLASEYSAANRQCYIKTVCYLKPRACRLDGCGIQVVHPPSHEVLKPVQVAGSASGSGIMSHLRAAAPAAKEGDRGRVSLAKVPRYWAGKRTDGAELDSVKDEPGPSQPGKASIFSNQRDDSDVKRTPVEAAVIVKKADPRLARLAKTDVSEARGEGRQRHRCGMRSSVSHKVLNVASIDNTRL